MLRKIRITLAVVFFVGITLLFLDFTGTVHAWLGWMAKIQFIPAVLALNFGIVAALVAVTLLLGRVYCSVICPLGVMQDIISHISGSRRKHRYRFRYSPAMNVLRIVMLVLFVAVLVAGLASLAALIAPYSAYGRIVRNLLSPLWLWGNNLLAYIAERADSYAFYSKEVWLGSLSSLVIATVTFAVIAVLAWRNGRTWCNTVCPVGTVLGFVAKFSWLKPVIDTSKCNGCSLCSRNCKASCIDAKNHRIDYSRCVACMDCVDTCKQHAISYRHPAKAEKQGNAADAAPDAGRRAFLSASAMAIGAAAAHATGGKVDGGLAAILDKEKPERTTPIAPPGAVSLRHFHQHCTACQLCVANCPNGVLRPSDKLNTLMQPEVSYERGYCRPECTRCSQVCPTGAIKPIDRAEKSSTKIGRAVWVPENCLPLTDGVRCGNCARHCPAGAIKMVPSDPSKKHSPYIPVVNDERCIGCGACENLCPARPFSAIYVEGNEVHRTI